MQATWVALCIGLATVAIAASAHGQVEGIDMPMRDGVTLRTTVFRPGPGAFPVVLTRGYYPWNADNAHAKRFNEAGYAFVSQQCRAGGGVDGSRFFPDAADGLDCVEWIAAQDWCDGNVAMWGGSYYGATQWRAAIAQPPSLKAIVPGFINAELWENGYWCHGAIHLEMTTHARAFPGGHKWSPEQWAAALMFVPLIDMDREFLGEENQLWNDYISRSTYDEYWQELGMRKEDRYEKVRIPVYCMSGFRDYYAGAAFESFSSLRRVGATEEVRIRVADQGHSGAPDIAETVRWLDWVIKGIDTGIKDEPPIKIQVRGSGWRQEREWPLPGTTFTKLYFSGSGELLEEPAGDEPPTTYTYDPDDPCPTLGANGSHATVPGLLAVGPVDQRPNEARGDVLVYTTPPLAQEAEVIGPVEATLYAASSARDTDFTVKLIDVQPDGTPLNVTEGIVRARFRDSIWEEPSLIEPGRVYEYRIELLPVALVFAQGHRIRVHISSSSWPLWDRNQNTGNPIGMDADVRIAEQTVHHDPQRPSHITLPLVR